MSFHFNLTTLKNASMLLQMLVTEAIYSFSYIQTISPCAYSLIQTFLPSYHNQTISPKIKYH